jgi:hypothetical protein
MSCTDYQPLGEMLGFKYGYNILISIRIFSPCSVTGCDAGQ